MRLPGLRRLVLTAILVTGRQVGAADWPQWLGPTRNGVSSELVAPWTEAPHVLWRASVGTGFSSPVVAGGLVFVHADVPGENVEVVTAWDALTGEEQWQERYPRAPFQSELGAGPRATPTVSDGRLYTLGITGALHCYDATSGRRLWESNPFDELKVPRPGFGVCCSPLVVDQRVIMPVGGTGSGVVAFDAQTGQIAWKGLDEPAGSASPVLLDGRAAESADRVAVVQTTLRLAGVRPVDGAVLWDHPLVFQPNGVSPTPLVRDDTLVCSTQDSGTLALSLPAASGASPTLDWWVQDLTSYFSTGTLDTRGRAFIVTNALMPLPRVDVRCLDLGTGTEQWRAQGLGYFHAGLIATGDGKLLILDDAGNLILGDPTADQFVELARSRVCGGTFCCPALADGRVYVRDRQEVVCLTLAGAAATGSGG
jgi:outer membrane protein assembly factor BamB